MGVDWISCTYCGENFPDCGHFVSCECGESWCSDECAEEDGFTESLCKLGHEVCDGYEQNEDCKNGSENGCDKCDNYLERSCKYCREEDFDDSVLIDFAMKLLDMNRSQLAEAYKTYKKEY